MCGLFGFLNYNGEKMNNLSALTNALAEQSAVRGTDATGIAYCNPTGITIAKENKSAFKLKFNHTDCLIALIGHTRHSTQGSEKNNRNNHPFFGRCINSKFAFAHNGVLYNDKTLRKEHKLPKTKIETDSYIGVQLIESQRYFNCDSIKYMAEKTEGSFSYSLLDDKNNIWLVKGDSPLSILHFPKLKVYVYASTDEILYKALIDYPPLFYALQRGEFQTVEIARGEILKIRSDGNLERNTFRYSSYSGREWWSYGSYSSWGWGDIGYDTKDEYIRDLKSIARFQGYTPDDVDRVIASGWELDEIEEYLYCGFGGEI